MRKLKKGDKVRFVKNLIWHIYDVKIGNIYTMDDWISDSELSVKETSDSFRPD